MAKKSIASKKYKECFPAANKWLGEHAPDFVVECVAEVTDHVLYLRQQIEKRDKFIRALCKEAGIDPSRLYQ
jgi:hypothetical protein